MWRWPFQGPKTLLRSVHVVWISKFLGRRGSQTCLVLPLVVWTVLSGRRKGEKTPGPLSRPCSMVGVPFRTCCLERQPLPPLTQPCRCVSLQLSFWYILIHSFVPGAVGTYSRDRVTFHCFLPCHSCAAVLDSSSYWYHSISMYILVFKMKGGGVLQRMCHFGGRVLRRKVVIQESRKASSTSVCSAFCAQDGPCVASNWRVFGLGPHCSHMHGQVFARQRETDFSSCSAILRRSFRRLPRCGCFRADLRWNCLAPRSVGDSRNHQWSNQDWKETYPENAQKGSAECPLSGAMMCNVTFVFDSVCSWNSCVACPGRLLPSLIRPVG